MAHDSTSNGRELLARLRQRLAGRIGQDRCAVWFGKQVEFRYGAGILAIAAGDGFSAERLRRTFRTDLESLCREHFPQITRIDFVVDELLRGRPFDEPAASKDAAPARTASGHAASDQTRAPLAAAAPVTTGRRFARLEEFIVGDENRVAHAAACAAPSRLGVVSPLFLHGPTGSGKTHVLEGVWSAVRRATPRAKCVYLSAEQFTSFFLEALQGSGLPSFRRKYREVQLLAIDDVQFFGGKRATLVELLHTIDTMHRSGGQLVLAADRPPAELSGLGPELIARMSAGLVCGLAPPETATRRAILHRLAEQKQMTVPLEVLELLAERLPGDARRLGGALNRLQAANQALGVPISSDLVSRSLADLFRQGQRPVELPDIERAICEVFGMDRPDLHSPRKAKAVAQPRMLAMWLARKHTRSALQDICRYFGRRSHSTVISAEKAVDTWMEDGAVVQLPQGACDVREAIRRVEARLNAG
jgi:chromosomal replication initiator protein